MTLIRRTNPFGETLSVHRAVDRLLKRGLVKPSISNAEEAKPRDAKIKTTSGRRASS